MWGIIEHILSLKDNVLGSSALYLMALVSRLSIFGPRSKVRRRSEEDEDDDDDDDLDDQLVGYNKRRRHPSTSVVDLGGGNFSCNVVDYLHRRELGGGASHAARPASFDANYGTRYLLQHGLFREKEISVHNFNKIFCSKWLSDRHVLFGTKCNKIPSLNSSRNSEPPDVPCGIHSIQTNPSQTLLATGAMNANDVAVYRLPTLDPVCVGEGAHRDWIFDAVWLDDQFFITGSRDTTIALWRVDEDDEDDSGAAVNAKTPTHSIMSPLLVRTCQKAEKVRALSFNHKHQEFVALSLDAYLHVWDVNTFKQKFSRKLPQCTENVCLAMRDDCSMLAVGSKSCLTLHDSRTLCAIVRVPTKAPACSIRSASFNDNLITLGTGMGIIMFYDCRAGKYLESKAEVGSEQATAVTTMATYGGIPLRRSTRIRQQIVAEYVEPVMLKANRGWVCPDEMFREVFQSIDYSPAIYTHCYDPSGTKLFTAGGPLPANLYGSYAGLWH